MRTQFEDAFICMKTSVEPVRMLQRVIDYNKDYKLLTGIEEANELHLNMFFRDDEHGDMLIFSTSNGTDDKLAAMLVIGACIYYGIEYYYDF